MASFAKLQRFLAILTPYANNMQYLSTFMRTWCNSYVHPLSGAHTPLEDPKSRDSQRNAKTCHRNHRRRYLIHKGSRLSRKYLTPTCFFHYAIFRPTLCFCWWGAPNWQMYFCHFGPDIPWWPRSFPAIVISIHAYMGTVKPRGGGCERARGKGGWRECFCGRRECFRH